ncbi:MAG: sigma 54-interacting transcriptional regulator [Deltaproteobacteria bacterium]|nr:sigma 54-interacting transcriptional regulator [Deltaproteobacteria bacterium]
MKARDQDRRRVLLQFAGTERNRRGHRERPGLRLATRRSGKGWTFADHRVLFAAYPLSSREAEGREAVASREVAEELAEDIFNERERRTPRRGGRATATAVPWSSPGSPRSRQGARPSVEPWVRAFLTEEGGHRTGTDYVVSSLTGTTAQWTLLAELLEEEGVVVYLALASPGGEVELRRVHPTDPRDDPAAPTAQRRLLDLGLYPGAWNVLLTGPTGVGKSREARRLHEAWRRNGLRSGDLVSQNMAALPEALVEATLFGHKRGAFTGAVGDASGLFVQAHKGTLFLDELGDLPLGLQARLLTTLDVQPTREGVLREVRPVGGEPRLVDVRLVCATLHDLRELVRAGHFREDLLGRIQTHQVELPPLRSARHRVLGALLDALEALSLRLDRGPVVQVHRPAIQALLALAFDPAAPWTWNHRDVQQAAERLGFAAWKARSAPGGELEVTEALVHAEAAVLRQRWRATASTSEGPSWGALRAAMKAGSVEALSELERYEASWLLEALQATASHAAAWRWLEERRLLPTPRGASANPADAFGKRWDKFRAHWLHG